MHGLCPVVRMYVYFWRSYSLPSSSPCRHNANYTYTLYYARTCASYCYPISNTHVHRPLHPPSKSKIKGLRTCSAFLLNDFSRKRLSKGVTSCAIIIALNISLKTSPHSTLTMSLWLVIKVTQEWAGERTLHMLAIPFFIAVLTYVYMAAVIFS